MTNLPHQELILQTLKIKEMKKVKTPSPNDMRSVVKNPNNPAYIADKINTIKQLTELPQPPKKDKS